MEDGKGGGKKGIQHIEDGRLYGARDKPGSCIKRISKHGCWMGWMDAAYSIDI